jgi:hypothetical protein
MFIYIQIYQGRNVLFVSQDYLAQRFFHNIFLILGPVLCTRNNFFTLYLLLNQAEEQIRSWSIVMKQSSAKKVTKTTISSFKNLQASNTKASVLASE